MPRKVKWGGAIKLMRSAGKLNAKSTYQPCVTCGKSFDANPTQLRVWGGNCYECFSAITLGI